MKTEYKAFLKIDSIRSIREDKREAEATISSTYPGRRGDLTEVLLHGRENIDLSRGPEFPVNLGHDTSGVNVGVAYNVRPAPDGKLRATLRFGKSRAASDVWEDVKSGVLKFVSIGYEVLKTTKPDSLGKYFVTLWRLLEVSLVSVAMDPSVGIGRSKNTNQKQEIKNFFKSERKEKIDMTKFEDTKRYWKDEQFKTLAEQFQAIRAFSEIGREDARLIRASGLEQDDFPVKSDFTTKLFQTGNITEAWSRATTIPIKNFAQIMLPVWDEKSRANGSILGGMNFQWIEQSATTDYSTPKFRMLDMHLPKIMALCPYTAELAADATSFDVIMEASAQKGLNYAIEDALINGTGAGQPLGLINSPCKIRVSKSVGQDSATVVLENVTDMLGRVLPESWTNGDLVFLGHPSVIPHVHTMGLAVGTGGSAVSSAWRWRSGGERHNKLFGLDFIICDRCSEVGTEGDIILVDLKSVIITYKPSKRATSADIGALFLTDQELMRITARINCQNILSQPILQAAGTDTLSTVITLESR